MSKAKQLRQELLKRIREGKYGCGVKSFYEFLEAAAEEVLEEIAKKKKVQAKH
ncbi:MAG: hypothetical protein ACE5I5_09035 [Candidatus Heimdallarchaeota archaeon]